MNLLPWFLTNVFKIWKLDFKKKKSPNFTESVDGKPGKVAVLYHIHICIKGIQLPLFK